MLPISLLPVSIESNSREILFLNRVIKRKYCGKTGIYIKQ